MSQGFEAWLLALPVRACAGQAAENGGASARIMSDDGDSGFGGDGGSTRSRGRASFHTGDNFSDLGQSFYGNMQRSGDNGRDLGYGGSQSGRTHESETIPPGDNPLRPVSPARSQGSSSLHHQRGPSGSDRGSANQEFDLEDPLPLRRTGTHESGLAQMYRDKRQPSAATIPSQDGHALQRKNKTATPSRKDLNDNGVGSSKNTYAQLREQRRSMHLQDILAKIALALRLDHRLGYCNIEGVLLLPKMMMKLGIVTIACATDPSMGNILRVPSAGEG
ncbi:hypothetical protein RHOSPDRAFT_27659 [Rhodotorula sp. JG-1b]|nr:hypothetical protein RHOSPDRAFT_27659 [Rhodotorula sp. JG-1b]